MKGERCFYGIILLMILCSMIVSGVGLFYSNGGQGTTVVNTCGDQIEIFGDGLYGRDSTFRVPIFKGTDAVILFLLGPLLSVFVYFDHKKSETRTQLILVSLIAVMTYYAANIVFGISYNALFLLYVMLFSLSFFGLILGITRIDQEGLRRSVSTKSITRGLYIFLVLIGSALLLAWLPDILVSLIQGRPLELIETYTTDATYVIDMCIISPTIFITIYLIKQRRSMGYILLQLILTCCSVIGVMVISQSIFQYAAGIELPIQVVLTKVASFVVLSVFALYYSYRYVSNMNN